MAAHRYWRINMTAGASTAYAFAEIQFRTAAGVSLGFSGGTASAADTFGGVPGANDASKAADANISTLYSSNNKTAPQWWAYDYGAGNALDIVEIAITARNDATFAQAPTTFAPQWSDDGTNWTSMANVTTAAWTSAGQVQARAVTVAPLVQVFETGGATANNVANVSLSALTTAQTDYILIVAAYNEHTGSAATTVSSVTSTGLTWALRKRSNSSTTGGLELWWAHGTGALSGYVITVHFAGAYDICAITYFVVTGAANPTAPFDTNVSMPAAQSSPSNAAWTPSFTSISTSSAADLLLFLSGSEGGSDTPASGFTQINKAISASGSWAAACWAEAQYVSALQTAATFTRGSALTSPFGVSGGESIFDALAGSLPAGGSAQARVAILA